MFWKDTAPPVTYPAFSHSNVLATLRGNDRCEATAHVKTSKSAVYADFLGQRDLLQKY
jgi:hypothetical protein